MSFIDTRKLFLYFTFMAINLVVLPDRNRNDAIAEEIIKLTEI